jgi:hypothetical protein
MKKLNTTYLDNLVTKLLNETLEEKADKLVSRINELGNLESENDFSDDEWIKVNELGEGEVGDFPKHQAFDYVDEEEESNEDEKPNYVKQLDDETCKYHMENFGPDDEMTKEFCKSEMTETLKGNQKVLDKNKNNKIDSEDFKLLRKDVKNESLCDKCGMDGCKCNHKKSTKESIKITESEMVNLIEKIILEQKTQNNINSIGMAKGYDKYKQVHGKSGKENQDSLDATAKKMREYTKPGSKGEYTESPTYFPKGNGELEKMTAKKYTMSDAGKEFVDNFVQTGQADIDYDTLQPNEEWMKDTIEGSSRTGNSSEYANAVKTDVNSNQNRKRKEGKLTKAKRMAYNKAPQPIVSDKPGEESGKGINIKLESMNDKTKTQLNEEFSKINSLMTYNRKTQ